MAVEPEIPLAGRWGGKLRDQNFELYRGGTRVLAVSVRDQAGKPLDLTGAGVEWTMTPLIKYPPTQDLQPVLVKRTPTEITVPNPSDGKMNIILGQGDTTNIDAGEYYHECRITDEASTVTAMKGIATILFSAFAILAPEHLLSIAAYPDDPWGMVIEETFEVADG